MKWLALLLLVACGSPKRVETGMASWYGRELAGRPTASGEPFRPSRRTAAHRSLPFGTVLRVTSGDRRVRVVVNDRGPYVDGRIIDLSRRAAARLGVLDDGVFPVTIQVVGCRRARFDGPRSCGER